MELKNFMISYLLSKLSSLMPSSSSSLSSIRSKKPSFLIALQQKIIFLGYCCLVISTIIFISSSQSYSYDLPSSNKPSFESKNLGYLQRLSLGLTELAASTKKAIVYISTSKTIDNPMGMLDPFDFFFGIPRDNRDSQPRRQEGVGSGFIIDLSKGYIITNNHVVENSDNIQIKFTNDQTHEGEIVGRDSNTDVAVIKVKDDKFNKTGLGQLVFHSGSVKVGELAIALGAPFSLEASLTLGVVSATQRMNLEITRIGDFIQTDAAINPGNSGGPLVNVFGNVIGVNTAIASRSGGSAGVGFAIPASLAKNIAEKLIKDGKIERGYIGVRMQALTPELAKSLGLPAEQKGVLVSDVLDDGPALEAGIMPGDIIIALNNKPIVKSNELVLNIGTKSPGTVVNLTVLRDNKNISIKMTIAAWPGQEDQLAQQSDKEKQESSVLGMKFVKLNDNLRIKHDFKSKTGFFVQSMEIDSVGYKAGIRRGDLIITVNKKNPSSVNELKKLLKQKSLLMRVERDGSFLFVAINQ